MIPDDGQFTIWDKLERPMYCYSCRQEFYPFLYPMPEELDCENCGPVLCVVVVDETGEASRGCMKADETARPGVWKARDICDTCSGARVYATPEIDLIDCPLCHYIYPRIERRA